MDTPSLAIPRLRLSRHSQSPNNDDGSSPNTPLAGPSRLVELNSDDDDAHSTPRLSTIAALNSPADAGTPPLQSASVSSPASRLRSLLALAPKLRQSSPKRDDAPPSELDSDFDPPRFSPASSIAQESLKDIFSRALRDAGDTPQKGRPRRNSIDVSEVEGSPRVVRERAKHKGKRKSMSDEEGDKSASKFDPPSEASFRSSQATTFDILRERLANSRGKDLSTIPANGSREFLRHLSLDSTLDTPPAATSTPQRSLQMPSQMQFESNLLDQDSEMNQALKGFDSYDGDSQRPLSFPPTQTSPQRSRTKISHSKSFSDEKTNGHTRRVSQEYPSRSSSRASSNNDGIQREREREWNKPHPKPPPTPDLHHRHSHGSINSSRSGSPHLFGKEEGGRGLSRRSSMASMSSRDSSFGSQAEYRERIKELEKERNAEREQLWNKRQPPKSPRPLSSLSNHRPTSSLGNHAGSPGHERSRTQSHPTRPDSAASLLTPEHPSLHQRSHSPAFSFSSSRAGSPVDEEVKEIVHERERNWNAPRPKWHQHPSGSGHISRSGSPLPPSPSHKHLHSHSIEKLRVDSPKERRAVSPTPPSPSPSRTHSHSHDRARAESLKSPGYGKPSLHKTTSRSSLKVQEKSSPRASSPQPRPNSSLSRSHVKRTRPLSYPARPTSPLPPPLEEHPQESESQSQERNSRFGWSFPRSRSPLPPLELDKESPERRGHVRMPSSPSPSPGSRPTSRTAGSIKPSHIPVRSPGKGHKRTTTELSESAGGIPPRIRIEEVLAKDEEGPRHEDSVFGSDMESPSPEGTPVLRTVLPPPTDNAVSSPPSTPPEHLVKDRTSSVPEIISPPTQSLSPPPTPPSDTPARSQPILELTTPPRRPSFSASKLEFETPPPPKGMPELPALPGPSSSSDDENDNDDRTPITINASELASVKTPKPPGAWTTTPVAPRRFEPPEDATDTETEQTSQNGLVDMTTTKTPKAPGAWSNTPVPPERVRSHSLSEADEHRPQNGLATPVASLSRADSLPGPTPAPPGGWTSSLSSLSAKRKSILKVRFDVEAAESSEGVADTSAEVDGHLPDHDDSSHVEKAFWGSAKAKNIANGKVDDTKKEANGTPVVESSVTLGSGPPSPRSQRKSPSVRVVDAFGREQLAAPEEPKATKSEETTDSRGKSTVRVVDAMGREVDEAETTDEVKSEEDDVPLSHNEAISRVRRSLAELANGLKEFDKSSDESSIDKDRFTELVSVSRTARDTRSKLSQTLRMARHGDNDMRNNYEPLRESMKKHKLLPAFANRRLSWVQMNSWIFWAIVALQAVFIIAMYRMSISRARHLFLTTYYDPFNPELHLHITNPDAYRHSMVSDEISGWSIFSLPSHINDKGWKAVAYAVWRGFSVTISDWQRWAWENWGETERQPGYTSWPPT